MYDRKRRQQNQRGDKSENGFSATVGDAWRSYRNDLKETSLCAEKTGYEGRLEFAVCVVCVGFAGFSVVLGMSILFAFCFLLAAAVCFARMQAVLAKIPLQSSEAFAKFAGIVIAVFLSVGLVFSHL